MITKSKAPKESNRIKVGKLPSTKKYRHWRFRDSFPL